LRHHGNDYYRRNVSDGVGSMKVALLADHAGAIDTLAAWYEREWRPYYGTHGPGDATADLASRCNRDRLPAGLVAIDGDTIIGTAALGRDAASGLAPAVIGLLVAPEYRRRGVAGALLDVAAKLAGELGYDELFMSTSILGGFLQREGWLEIGDVNFMNSERGKMYGRSLSAERER
jgi:GNAT superfamily N-acetyltransferase